MDEDGISVVSIPNMSSREECEDNRKANAIDSKEKYVSYWNICYVFAVLACCTVFSSTVTLMPRSNSIFYQTHWFEFSLHFGLVSLLLAGSVQLNMIVWFRSKTLQSFWIFLRIYTFLMMLWILPYVMAYVIWCIYFGYNWPIPYLGYNYLIGSLVYPIGIWFIFPKSLRVDAEFQKKYEAICTEFGSRSINGVSQRSNFNAFQSNPVVSTMDCSAAHPHFEILRYMGNIKIDQQDDRWKG